MSRMSEDEATAEDLEIRDVRRDLARTREQVEQSILLAVIARRR